ncbi:MAG: hypothetical protein CMO55_12000 [Verrucomicrobiales bacterium]|nr:hypothetical protein [Verrucomicrobiales bacterium]
MNAVVSNIWNYVTGGATVVISLCFVIAGLIRIHREIGITSSWGWFWVFVVVVGNVFGFVLFVYFRDKTEGFVSSLFEKY